MTINRKKIGFLTFPLSIVYGIITGIRNLFFNHQILKQTSFPIPIICVGNITVGGTGKTPHVEYLVKLLMRDFNIAVLSRGFKRKTNDFLLASHSSSIKEIGDEPKQIKQKFPKTIVAVSKKRVEGVTRLLSDYPNLHAVILDDAYQHRYIKPGLSILLVDYHRPLISDNHLPFGDLRESKREIKRAHIIIVTKTPEHIKPIEKRIFIKDLTLYPFQFLYFTTFVYGNPVPVFKKSAAKHGIELFKDHQTSLLLVTGIASPKPLFDYLKKLTPRIRHMQFPDHHAYSYKDFEKIKDELLQLKHKHNLIITSEKDAMRINELKNLDKSLKDCMYYIPVEVKFLDNGARKFNKDLLDYVGKNKEINRLHK